MEDPPSTGPPLTVAPLALGSKGSVRRELLEVKHSCNTLAARMALIAEHADTLGHRNDAEGLRDWVEGVNNFVMDLEFMEQAIAKVRHQRNPAEPN